MKLYVLFILMLPMGVWHLELSPLANMPCMDRCLMDFQNELANAHAELALNQDQPQDAHQLAECRLNVHKFDCTLKCMFEKYTLPWKCSQNF